MNDDRRRNDKEAADEPVPARMAEAERQLLDYLEEQRDRRCRSILERADAEADALRRDARHRASKVVSEAIRRERSRRAGAIREEHARMDAELRRKRFQREGEQLASAGRALATELSRRWREDPEARRQWIRMACEQARAFLPDGTWRTVHPAGWDSSEARAAVDALERVRPEVELCFEAGEQDAGLYLTCGSASVDTRPSGLLADRSRVDGLLLRALEPEGLDDAGTEEEAS